MYYLKFKDLSIVGASPEVFVRCEDGRVELRPIAGTRRRGKDAVEDRLLEKELLASDKERAEHIMLVDLGRNDLGRVCDCGSVKVKELMTIERYSHVMHIVSDIVGRMKKGRDAFDLIGATFPAGTVSGAPKIRAMEIISEIEDNARGPYAGCIVYFSFSGNLDSCITIRTIIIKDKDAYVQAGAGIVADSNPEAEYEETLNKARAMFKAIELANQGISG
jgi:anthranilate synthase component 1